MTIGKFRLPGNEVLEITEQMHKLYWDTVTWTVDAPRVNQRLFITPPGEETVDTVNGDRVHRTKTHADTNWMSNGPVLHDFALIEVYVEPISGDEALLSNCVLQIGVGNRPLLDFPLSSCVRGWAYVEQMNAWHFALECFRKAHPELYVEGYYVELDEDSPCEPRGPSRPGRLVIPVMFSSRDNLRVEVSSYKAVKVPTTFRVYFETFESKPLR